MAKAKTKKPAPKSKKPDTKKKKKPPVKDFKGKIMVAKNGK